MKILVGVLALFASSASIACGTPTQRTLEAWHDRKVQARHFIGRYLETARTLSVEKSDSPSNGDLETTTVEGVVVDRRGRVKAKVYYSFTNEIGICTMGRKPESGQSGTIFSEKIHREREGFYIIDFSEARVR